MGVESRSVAPAANGANGANGAPAKRRLRNYLLDSRFQLKYTGMVVGVTVMVATVLGYFAYNYSRGQTEALQVQMAMQPDLNPQVAAQLDEVARAEDRKVLFGIVGGIAILAIALGFTGIVVTHKVVGPAYKMKLMLRRVAQGHLKVEGSLRKGDELKDVFIAFNDMIEELRSSQAEEVAMLDEALGQAERAGTPTEVLRIFREVRDRMQSELD
jgi:methyl-accepting chemotaxis protein